MSELVRLLQDLPEADEASAASVRARTSQVLRPTGAFQRLDDVSVWLAQWQATERPAVRRPHAILFAGDHGVAADGVSAYPAEVTAVMVDALRQGRATASVLAAEVGAKLDVVDVGVGRPTGNIRVEAAMTADQFNVAVRAGVTAVDGVDTDLLVLGEMGIGNTTAAAAVAAAVVGGTGRDWVGAGTGVSGAALSSKVAAVEQALARVGSVEPLDALRELGGFELAAIAGAVMAARHRRIPLVVDGFIVTAAIAPLAATNPSALFHCMAGHCSAEAGHRRLLDRLGLDPLLDLGLRLGEGSGALLAVPLVCAAAVAAGPAWAGAVAIAAITTVGMGVFAKRAFGGVTGDVLGSIEQLAEVGVFVVAAPLVAEYGWTW